MNIKDVILSIIKDEVKPTLIIGKVKSFNQDTFTCDVNLITAPDVYDVRIKAVINKDEKAIRVKPRFNSNVILASINGKIESSIVLAFEDIEEYYLNADQIAFNGDSNGGLVIAKKVATQFKELKDELNDLKQILTQWVPVLQDGGTSLKTLINPWLSPLAVKQDSYFENKKVKHGE